MNEKSKLYEAIESMRNRNAAEEKRRRTRTQVIRLVVIVVAIACGWPLFRWLTNTAETRTAQNKQIIEERNRRAEALQKKTAAEAEAERRAIEERKRIVREAYQDRYDNWSGVLAQYAKFSGDARDLKRRVAEMTTEVKYGKYLDSDEETRRIKTSCDKIQEMMTAFEKNCAAYDGLAGLRERCETAQKRLEEDADHEKYALERFTAAKADVAEGGKCLERHDYVRAREFFSTSIVAFEECEKTIRSNKTAVTEKETAAVRLAEEEVALVRKRVRTISRALPKERDVESSLAQCGQLRAEIKTPSTRPEYAKILAPLHPVEKNLELMNAYLAAVKKANGGEIVYRGKREPIRWVSKKRRVKIAGSLQLDWWNADVARGLIPLQKKKSRPSLYLGVALAMKTFNNQNSTESNRKFLKEAIRIAKGDESLLPVLKAEFGVQ